MKRAAIGGSRKSECESVWPKIIYGQRGKRAKTSSTRVNLIERIYHRNGFPGVMDILWRLVDTRSSIYWK